MVTRMGSGPKKIETPEILSEEMLEIEEDRLYEMMINSTYNSIEEVKEAIGDIRIKPEFLLKGGFLRMHTSWKELNAIAFSYEIDISDFEKLHEKAEAISHIRRILKQRESK